MQHLLYLSDRVPVCYDPPRLGQEFITSAGFLGPSCRVCYDLVTEQNVRYDKEFG